MVKLRSIGDTVLATPSLFAIKRFAPHVQVDILLEDWVAPVLDGFEYVDNILTVSKGNRERLSMAWELSRGAYDIAINLHGGTTATFFTASTLARHRVGISTYQYPVLYNHLLKSSAHFWGRDVTHSAEQQLALPGFLGIPVDDLPRTHLAVTEKAVRSIANRLGQDADSPFALIHPTSAFITKRWSTDNYAAIADHLARAGLGSIAIASPSEKDVLAEIKAKSNVPVTTITDLSLPEITALASRAKIFVGNDSGIAHISAAVSTPSVVIFGSSNRDHWRPWTDAPNEIVFNPFPCQPCPGYECAEFGEPRCILSVTPESVFAAVSRILEKAPS